MAGGGMIEKIKAQNFGENDSQIISALAHPKTAATKLSEWLKHQVNTAAGNPVQPTDEGDIYASAPDRFTRAMAALNVAGFAEGGSMPFAPKSAGGTLGTFTGPKSAIWNHDAAATATKLLDNGADPAQVWKDHLIGRLPDRKLFSEIDDSQAQLNPSALRDYHNESSLVRQSRMMSHPSLESSYPDMSSIAYRKGNDSGASYVPGSETIYLQKDAGHPDMFPQMREDLVKSPALHELQHAIQNKEGWARGGSSKEFHDLTQKSPMHQSLEDVPYEQLSLDERRALIKLRNDFNKQEKLSPFDQYERLTGEAQARATQDRMSLNMQQRRDAYPLAGDKLSDIPLSRLIYRYRQ